MSDDVDEDFTLAVSLPSLDDLLLRAVPVSLLAEDTKKSLIPSKLDFRLLTPGLDSPSASSDSGMSSSKDGRLLYEDLLPTVLAPPVASMADILLGATLPIV